MKKARRDVVTLTIRVMSELSDDDLLQELEPRDLSKIQGLLRSSDPRLAKLDLGLTNDPQGIECYEDQVKSGRTSPVFLMEDLRRLADALAAMKPFTEVHLWLCDENDHQSCFTVKNDMVERDGLMIESDSDAEPWTSRSSE